MFLVVAEDPLIATAASLHRLSRIGWASVSNTLYLYCPQALAASELQRSQRVLRGYIVCDTGSSHVCALWFIHTFFRAFLSISMIESTKDYDNQLITIFSRFVTDECISDFTYVLVLC